EIIRGRSGHALEPDLAVVAELSCEAIGANERVGQPPASARKLAERLAHPARQSQIVETGEDRAVFFPEPVARRFRIGAHVHRMLPASPNIKVEVSAANPPGALALDVLCQVFLCCLAKGQCRTGSSFHPGASQFLSGIGRVDEVEEGMNAIYSSPEAVGQPQRPEAEALAISAARLAVGLERSINQFVAATDQNLGSIELAVEKESRELL